MATAVKKKRVNEIVSFVDSGIENEMLDLMREQCEQVADFIEDYVLEHDEIFLPRIRKAVGNWAYHTRENDDPHFVYWSVGTKSKDVQDMWWQPTRKQTAWWALKEQYNDWRGEGDLAASITFTKGKWHLQAYIKQLIGDDTRRFITIYEANGTF
jgi:hypothetical protein